MFVNGEEKSLIQNDLKFLSVELDEGENTVEFVDQSPHWKLMGIGALVAVLGLCAVAVVEKKTKWVDLLSPVLAWAGVALALVVIAFFMLFPSATFAVKLVRLLL